MLRRAFRKCIKRSFETGVIACIFLCIFATPALCGNLVINHTNWDWYNSQSQPVVDRVASQKIFFAHASVGDNIMEGFSGLNTANSSKYPLNQTSAGDTPPGTTFNGTIYEYNRGNPGWSAKVSDFVGYIDNGWHSTAVDIVMNKFCFIDQDVDWAAYRQSMLTLEAGYPATKFIYWTMPLTTDSDSDAVLRAQFNQDLRNWIATQNNKILFDIADIEAWSPAGVHQTFTYNEQQYEHMYADYSSDGGHLNTTGSERVATGLYSLFALVTGGGNALYANFTGNGAYKYNGTAWSKINTLVPSGMAASRTDLYAGFTGNGLYKYSGTAWSKINTLIPTGMAASAWDLYASFTGNGLYKYNGTSWSKINTLLPTGMAASATNLYASFAGSGLYKYNGTAWSKINTLIPSGMAASGTDLYASFTGNGLYKYNGTTWSRINTLIPADMTASYTDLYANFTGNGLYRYNGTAWSKINSSVSTGMAGSR